jgi:ABC-type phosphate transport system substrate-binding protein
MKATFVKFIFVFALLVSHSSAQEYAVIANKSIKELSLGEVRAIFLKKILYTKDVKVLPVNLSSRDSIRRSFEHNVLKMRLSKLKSYWTKQHYLGRRPPKTMKSQNTIKAFVKKVNGAIAYIDKENVDENMTIIYTWRD